MIQWEGMGGVRGQNTETVKNNFSETCYNHLQNVIKGKGILRSPQLTSLKRSKILSLIMLASLHMYRYFLFVYLHVWVSIFYD